MWTGLHGTNIFPTDRNNKFTATTAITARCGFFDPFQKLDHTFRKDPIQHGKKELDRKKSLMWQIIYLSRMREKIWEHSKQEQEDLKKLAKDLYLLMTDAEEGRCGHPDCKHPGPCHLKRRSKSKSGLFLYSTWDCVNPEKTRLETKTPYSQYLLHSQRIALDKRDETLIKEAQNKKGKACDSIRCGQRGTCILQRMEQSKAGRKAYHLTTCITTNKSGSLAGRHQTATDQNHHKDPIRSTNETNSEKTETTQEGK